MSAVTYRLRKSDAKLGRHTDEKYIKSKKVMRVKVEPFVTTRKNQK